MIPILINNRDLLTTVRKQIGFFHNVPDCYIVLCDNDSTYPPLREWMLGLMTSYPHSILIDDNRYKRIWFSPEIVKYHSDCPHELFLFPTNLGPRGSQTILHLLNKHDAYFMSDADMDYSDLKPEHLLTDLLNLCTIMPHIQGAGVGIRIDDLPDSEWAEYARVHETGSWIDMKTAQMYHYEGPETQKLEWMHYYYVAPCDTAGVLRPLFRQWDGGYLPAVRSAEHIARHLPWYFVPAGWKCPTCRGKNQNPWSQDPKDVALLCGCDRGIPMPDDFKHFYSRADGAGTCYTARITDKTRPSIL